MKRNPLANKNLNDHLLQLSESEVDQIKKYTSLSKDELSKRYQVISEMVFEKLETLSKSSDNETKQRIDETVKRIKTQDINTLSFIKLKSLNETL